MTVSVVCHTEGCGWRGNRRIQEDPPKYGTCPKCQQAVDRTNSMDAKRNAVAKADLRRYRGGV